VQYRVASQHLLLTLNGSFAGAETATLSRQMRTTAACASATTKNRVVVTTNSHTGICTRFKNIGRKINHFCFQLFTLGFASIIFTSSETIILLISIVRYPSLMHWHVSISVAVKRVYFPWFDCFDAVMK